MREWLANPLVISKAADRESAPGGDRAVLRSERLSNSDVRGHDRRVQPFDGDEMDWILWNHFVDEAEVQLVLGGRAHRGERDAHLVV